MCDSAPTEGEIAAHQRMAALYAHEAAEEEARERRPRPLSRRVIRLVTRASRDDVRRADVQYIAAVMQAAAVKIGESGSARQRLAILERLVARDPDEAARVVAMQLLELT